MLYEILEVHIKKVGPSYKITVAIESSPHRFKAYGHIGTEPKVSEEVFQQLAANGGKMFRKDAEKMFPDLLKNYKYEG